jgi:hypothetical protein
MLIYGLAIVTYLFNNNTQIGKTYFIRKLLNSKGYKAIYADCIDADFASIFRY